MSTNPYLPPSSPLQNEPPPDAVPALWNPNAAANWCLLFSPAFGAYLHMKNWQALGDPVKAAASKTWFLASLGLLVAVAIFSVLMPESKTIDSLIRPVGLGLLISWYVSSARPQATLVKERFGTAYPHKGWTRPLLLAVLCMFGFFLVVFILAFIKILVSPPAA